MCLYFLFFFTDTPSTEIYTLSLHDALPISHRSTRYPVTPTLSVAAVQARLICVALAADRKSTRLNSSHANISYAVFCLKKKKIIQNLSSYTMTPQRRATYKLHNNQLDAINH